MKSFKIRTIEDNFLYELILAIITQACLDWYELSTKGKFRALDYKETYLRQKSDLIRFFESDWAEVLFRAVNVDNKYILRLLNSEYPLKEDNNERTSNKKPRRVYTNTYR